MDTAFETETKRMVKAWVIGKDTSYIKPQEDTFFANPDEIQDYEDTLERLKLDNIEVRFKKSHIRVYDNGNKTLVVPHFFIPNKNKLNIQTLLETIEHKKIKSFMYDYFFSNSNLELPFSKYIQKKGNMINKINLDSLNIQWDNFSLKKEDFFEVNLIDTFNTRRVDLFLPFKEYNVQFGHGLVIEVQLSSQSEEKLKERTIDRALKGYSTIWIQKNDFINYKNDILELKDIPFINSYHSVLHNNSKKLADNIYTKMKKYSREFDDKIEKLRKDFNDFILREGMLCPKCKKGELIKKSSRYGVFLGCSNWNNLDFKCDANYKVFEEKENE